MGLRLSHILAMFNGQKSLFDLKLSKNPRRRITQIVAL